MTYDQDTALPPDYTILFVAPFYNRSGYGMGARALVGQWVKAGLPLRIISVDEVEEGVDDFDTTLLRRLEKTPITGKVIAVFYHVPNKTWLELNLPPGSLRVMLTTFDGILQGDKPPPNWLQVCNAMDLVFLNEFEISGWNAAGLRTGLARPLVIPHIWLDNPYIHQPVFGGIKKPVRFLTIAMFHPRRRWDTLLAAFLQEFADDARMRSASARPSQVNGSPWSIWKAVNPRTRM